MQEVVDRGSAMSLSDAAELDTAVAEVVEGQIFAGVDVVNDGECSRRQFIGYVLDRITGVEGRTVPADDLPPNVRVAMRDRRDFPGFYEAELGGFGGVHAKTQARAPRTAYYVTEPLKYVGAESATKDCRRLVESIRGREVDGYISSVGPGTLEHWLRNDYYESDEAFLYALADVMHEEYRIIADSGLILQVDNPDLPDAWQMFPDMSVEEYRDYARLRVEALTYALRDIPEEQIRMHMCWGSQHGPHLDDIPLAELVDLVLSVPAQCYSIEASNSRHEYDWKVWEDVKLPDGKLLMPGVVGHAANVIEHPETVAQRLIRYADLVGRENVIAGTDCGLGGRVGNAEIAWAKLAALSAGAASASAHLWHD
jgi:5-methyltetrahydropteroyltriglutamate--homocysteine methyltransferase